MHLGGMVRGARLVYLFPLPGLSRLDRVKGAREKARTAAIKRTP